MRTKSKTAHSQLARLGGPPVGTVTALGVARQAGGYVVFVGSRAGLFRAVAEPGRPPGAWERLANAPVALLALAVSPAFAHDQRLVAGTLTGLHYSTDGGETWRASAMPMTETTITTLVCSPHYPQDSLILAGTLEDGVYYSPDRGAQFVAKSFGLLDASVLSIAFSPDFAQDATVFLGAETTAYYSYNGGLAWKDLHFPSELAPVLSLAVSAGFAADRTLYAGTEQHGLHVSADAGQTWQPLPLPAATVNALAAAPGELLAATEAGLLRSTDGGHTWAAWLDRPNVVGLAAAPDVSVAGAVEQGVWLAEGREAWHALPGLSARSMLGLALAPNYDRRPVAFMYGPQEGLWRTTDGGQTWASLEDKLPSLDIAALAISPKFAQDQIVVAAALEGLSLSADGGDTWEKRADPPADLVAYSPGGQLLLASFPAAGLRASVDHGQNWLPFPGPWDQAGKLAALAVSDTGHFYIAYLEGVGESLALYHGQPKQLEKALTEPVARNAVVLLHVPAEPAAERPWYLAVGHQVWRLSARAQGRAPAAVAVFDPAEHRETLITLTGGAGPNGPLLLAGTGRRLFQSTDGGETWAEAFNFGQDRAVSVTLSPAFAADRTIYVLLLGGSLCRLKL
ncbi:MAG: hypothetical protein IT317_00580 [Anaerolineales bacterium]|nr:hypothetical protein [Anaerolineales bacterium]